MSGEDRVRLITCVKPVRLQEVIQDSLKLRLDVSEVHSLTSPVLKIRPSENRLTVLIIPLPVVQTLSAGKDPAHEKTFDRWVERFTN